MVRWECSVQVTGKAAKTQPWWLLCVTKDSVPKLVALYSVYFLLFKQNQKLKPEGEGACLQVCIRLLGGQAAI